MQVRRIAFAPEAAEDLIGLYDWIAAEASPVVAIAYIDRVEAFCHRLKIGSERRLTIAFTVGEDAVTILRIFAAGRNWETTL